MLARTVKIMIKSKSKSKGISLLEILISIGVVAIGLVGVASLVPLAHSKAERGLQRDRSTQFGNRAFREWKVRGFDRPNVDQTNAPQDVRDNTLKVWVVANSIAGDRVPFVNPPFGPRAFCFDPLFVATRRTFFGLNSNEQPNVAVENFPDRWATGTPENFDRNNIPVFAIPRLTLASPVSPLDPASQINRWFAEENFMLHDDLQIEVDENDDDKRKQQFTWTDTNGIGIHPFGRRNRDSAYSWFATLTPESRLAYNTIDWTRHFSQASGDDRYLLSVVVLKRREIFHRDHNVTPRPDRDIALPNQELLALVEPPAFPNGRSFSKTSVSGSTTRDLHLFPYDASNKELGATFGDLRPGSWIAIGQQLNNPDGTVTDYDLRNSVNTIRWVKVVSTPEFPPANETNGIGSLIVTVEGPDFSFRRLDPTKPAANGDIGYLIPTYAIYVRDVINVYEKTIRLDTTP